MATRVISAALVFFAIACALGAALAVIGPVPAFRGLGLAMLGFGLAGCGLQVYALHEFAPAAYAALRERLAGLLPAARLAPARAA